ncbi:cystathionine gamma-lyase-like isoform X1 [Bradysia coprophila]|uniref:cystathionine gamma-lyase-like isoform X1 n=1 Tax=Bradysia coprophila TaxID=38358 RepID=UPI00187DC93B|nr:cystathionine gamma-lyase-like isoform X1 [Bradysia coprophila]
MSVITQYKYVQDEPINPWHHPAKKALGADTNEQYDTHAINNESNNDKQNGIDHSESNGIDEHVDDCAVDEKAGKLLTKVGRCDGNSSTNKARPSVNEEIGYLKQEPGFALKAIHAGQKPELWQCKAVVLPIYMTTSYKKQDLDPTLELNHYDNPTRTVLENTLAALDVGKYCLSFPSGTGGQMTLISTMTPGDRIICGDNIYTGTIGLFRDIAVNFGIETDFVDLTKHDHLRKALTPKTKMVWMETPTNPMMIVLDIRGIAEIVHKESSAILVVDNTPLSSYFQRPLMLGADAVAYSLTKFMNGHNDVVMGSISTNSQDLYEKLKLAQNITGIIPSPFDCYMVYRSLKTLAIRMERHSENALILARYLESHPRVSKVLHPGLPSHPQHKLAISQSYGQSGSFCFYIKDGTLDMTKKFLKTLNVFMWADSLGGCESLAQAPLLWFAVPTTFSNEEVIELGLVENLIRLSCGLEDVQFLIEDLNQALNGL